ncbi:MAG: aspartyl/glutamyl-tRNA amidotransferase subunit C [candidate division WS6 bacterium GW2011_GWA2_37_6]|uniref:Aspartyl/glutamyl-tRNA(Asn/Gln) amidotransferase subunit C n=1 Tax=candidate division WS6 bacterium GW2011_GWA2_37_6 TaxID=1619087 RepID=A0A0G0K3R2_9BACT|nr:MAG: aspartyl/glutamyl-tRNA amidotransferase subunit C [candidate division WS6 bacterium GW2011_GWA2_37_6]
MTKPIITKEQVKHIADLAKIDLSPHEIEKYQKELASILEYVKKIQEVDTKKIDFKTHVGVKNVYREDVPTESLTQEEAVSQAKNKYGYIIVPTVITKK